MNEGLRLERHQELRDAARWIIATDGLPALTMQRLADEAGCSIGSLYRYIPSKDALIAELQRDAIDVVATSFQLSQSHLDELLDRRGVTDPALASLAQLMAAARFWVAAETVFPQEIELSRLVFTEPLRVIEDIDAGRVVPAGMRLLELAGYLLDHAVATGALHDGVSLDRAVVVISGTAGVLMISTLQRWDPQLFDGQRLAVSMVRDLFSSWGADAELLSATEELIAELADQGRLVPRIEAGA